MGRRCRNQSEPLCYHLTHRCHGRDFLLKFEKDRCSYLMRLHQMSRRYPVDVLTYMITRNQGQAKYVGKIGIQTVFQLYFSWLSLHTILYTINVLRLSYLSRQTRFALKLYPST